MSNSRNPGGFIGGENILSANGGSFVMECEQSYLNVLESITNEEISGLIAVGWLIEANHRYVRIFENKRAGGRRYAYESTTEETKSALCSYK